MAWQWKEKQRPFEHDHSLSDSFFKVSAIGMICVVLDHPTS